MYPKYGRGGACQARHILCLMVLAGMRMLCAKDNYMSKHALKPAVHCLLPRQWLTFANFRDQGPLHPPPASSASLIGRHQRHTLRKASRFSKQRHREPWELLS